MSNPSGIRITNEQFFLICDEMRNCYEQLQKCETQQSAIELLSKVVGFTIPKPTFSNAASATKLSFQFRTRQKESTNNTRILCNAVIALYKEVGMTVPHNLQQMQNGFDGRNANVPIQVPVKDTQLIPARSATDPKTVAVNNRS